MKSEAEGAYKDIYETGGSMKYQIVINFEPEKSEAGYAYDDIYEMGFSIAHGNESFDDHDLEGYDRECVQKVIDVLVLQEREYVDLAIPRTY